jgi:hypothetical protein
MGAQASVPLLKPRNNLNFTASATSFKAHGYFFNVLVELEQFLDHLAAMFEC